METWKDIPNYEGYYQVSDMGRVKSLERVLHDSVKKYRRVWGERILAQSVVKGYWFVRLSKEGYTKSFRTNRLVLMSFLHPSELHVDHINNIKTDNRLVNLQYLTQLENNIKMVLSLGKTLPIGVSEMSSGRYRVDMRRDGIAHSLGSYDTINEAQEVYLKCHEDNSLITQYETQKHRSPYGMGVSKSGKGFVARIRVNGVSNNLGCFNTPELAQEAYKIAHNAKTH